MVMEVYKFKLCRLVLLIICCHLIGFSVCDPGSDCPKTRSASLTNYTYQFSMAQHQLRGVVNVIDDCSFKVSQFDMLEGSDVRFWGSVGDHLENLTKGFVISEMKLNKSFKSDDFVVKLIKNVTWDDINVLAVWDLPMASDFGHVVLRNLTNGTEFLAPLESEVNGTVIKGSGMPTMFNNCKVLADNYRVRWSLNEEEDVIEIGLEAAIGFLSYMAFGWANPNASSSFMIGGDVTVTGFKEDLSPFADDYFITKYSECMISKDGRVEGVCPDTIYEGSDPVGLVNNTRLLYGHRKDGVSFIRFRKPLKSIDTKYDLPLNQNATMRVIWALGLIKPPDSLRPFYLPQNHGGSYGHLTLNVSEHVDDCLGPLDAEDKQDQDLVIADKKGPIVVSTGPAVFYPNPPNPSKVLYLNKKEAPLLRVERGVQVKFSIQAGHDVAFYITSDPLGGNATLRNMSETIYFGGPEAQGVQATPTELVWAPDRNTPDLVYYQSLYAQKMGWKVQVVDAGLPDMYNSSVVLDDQQVTFFWTLAENSISIAARGEKKSGYLALGFGRGMVDSYAYVGWVDDTGIGKVSTYWIDGRDSSNIHPTNENLTHVRCKSENGIITMEFTRPLRPSCDDDKPECKNIVDPTTPLKVIWAMGAQWSDGHLSVRNMHSVTSSRPIRVLLMRGSAEAEEDLRPVLAVHGFMMFLAWGILLPGGILAARYLKHVKGDGWFQIHVYLQYSGLSIVFLGFLFAVAELRGLSFSSLHVKFGMLAIVLAIAQPVNAYLRPKKPGAGEEVSSKRHVWEYIHVIVGRGAILVGIAALITGMKHLGERYGDEDVHRLMWALILWILVGALTVMYLEYRERKRRRDRISGRSNWVLGSGEEEDIDLLSPSQTMAEKDLGSSDRMEVQLEPISR
ncbi:cytochrome b561, DM13 and DOMON domain-containing protein At5g54830 [Lycium barbarum]|uniref:cytochrome b561, DM13 and DOMON domain-containing protein At5g54830 n=1 Tax=Lycium barbarum TaxID=112863 RepID=UPI00293F4D08|nr:cytochrome b561, DM13 and DOMON domain-containing protein At5g54830 [Lycium barbarum]